MFSSLSSLPSISPRTQQNASNALKAALAATTLYLGRHVIVKDLTSATISSTCAAAATAAACTALVESGKRFLNKNEEDKRHTETIISVVTLLAVATAAHRGALKFKELATLSALVLTTAAAVGSLFGKNTNNTFQPASYEHPDEEQNDG